MLASIVIVHALLAQTREYAPHAQQLTASTFSLESVNAQLELFSTKMTINVKYALVLVLLVTLLTDALLVQQVTNSMMQVIVS